MDTKIKVYIVEDVAITRMSLETMLLENNYHVVGSSADAETAWKQLQTLSPDLILLDINLAGEKTGVWLAKKIRANQNISIVYLTAFSDQQTLKEVLNTKPDGYLMKPYQETTLLTTITIALTNFLERQKKTLLSDATDVTARIIYIKDRNIRVKLTIDDICFVKSDGNYLEIKLENKTYVVRNKLSEFLKQLPSNEFFQCHRRYIINIKKIDLLGKDFITILKFNIPTSIKYRISIEKSLSIV